MCFTTNLYVQVITFKVYVCIKTSKWRGKSNEKTSKLLLYAFCDVIRGMGTFVGFLLIK